MKFIIIVSALAVISIATVCESAIAKANFANPTYPGKCVLDLNTIMSPGQSGKAPNHPCAGVTCMEHGHVEFKTCPAVAPPKGCKMRDFVNTNRSYPECCERAYDCTKDI